MLGPLQPPLAPFSGFTEKKIFVSFAARQVSSTLTTYLYGTFFRAAQNDGLVGINFLDLGELLLQLVDGQRRSVPARPCRPAEVEDDLARQLSSARAPLRAWAL